MRDREGNHKHGRFVSRFEHTCFTSPPSTLWRIFTIKRSHRITRCRNTYKRVHTSTPLDSLVPLLFPQEQTHASTQAWTRNTANLEVRLLKVQWWKLWWSQYFDHLKSLSQQLSYRIDLAMENSSMCEKNKDWICGEKLKKSLLKTLDKLSFWFGNIGSKTCG